MKVKVVISKIIIIVAFLSLLAFTFAPKSLYLSALPALNAYDSGITVSGLSSGGFMAGQFHVAHSSSVVGVGVFSAGPYLCSRGNFGTAAGKCTSSASTIDDEYINGLLSATKKLEEDGQIDRLENLQNDKVYIFHGDADPTVHVNAAHSIKQWYQLAAVPEEQILLKVIENAGHAFPTNHFGNSCEADTEPPWISKCGFDGGLEMMTYLYGELQPKKESLQGELIEFNQTEFFGEKLNSMADKGYAYVPKNCRQEKCRIHIFFHGCQQGYDMVPQDRKDDDPQYDNPPYSKIEKTVINNVGLNNIADTNSIIVLYPQLKQSKKPFNPRGCYDFWGYVMDGELTYATKSGEQISTVYRMVDRLSADNI